MAQRHQLLARRVSGVPRAQTFSGLIRHHDVVLGVVEDGAAPVLLLPDNAGSCVGDQTSAGREFPQLDHRVLPRREHVLAVLGEDDGRDAGAVVGLEEGVDAAARHAVPDLDVAVVGAGDVDSGVRGPPGGEGGTGELRERLNFAEHRQVRSKSSYEYGRYGFGKKAESTFLAQCSLKFKWSST